MPGSAGQIFHVIFMAFVIIYYVLFLYVYPVLAKFYNTIRNTIKNALFMAIRHLPYTVVMVLIGLCPLLLLFIGSYQIQSTLFVLFLVMGFGVIAYCNSFFLVKIFDHYMPKEENEEQKKRRHRSMNTDAVTQQKNWNGKPYHSLDHMLRERFGEKVYKVTLNGGMSCPNRDGKLGSRGCIFCSAGGSGDFAADAELSVTEQIDSQIALLSAKRPIHKYIAYFQAYTNTYAPVEYLRKIFTEALAHPSVVALSIGTRPDCLGEDVLDLLNELNQRKPVWVELGLQTMHERTAAYIRRGYPFPVLKMQYRICGSARLR